MHRLLFLSIVVLQVGCANGLRAFCIKDDSIINVSEAHKIADQYINSKPGKRENYLQNPIIYNDYYVFPNSFSFFQSTALNEGIWINRKTGHVGSYKELKTTE